MNYITEINAFHDSLLMNDLSTGQIALWYALMYVNNMCNWIEWFSATNKILSIQSGLSKSGIDDARNVLKQKGYIDFKPRGTKSTMYTIVTRSNSGRVTSHVTVQDTVRNTSQVTSQDSVPLNKPKYKLKKKDTKVSKETVEHCENSDLNKAINEFIADREERDKKKMTDRAIGMMVKKLMGMGSSDTDRIGILNQSIINGWKGIFELKDGKGSKSNASQPKPNRFHNFEPRDTDYDELARQKLQEMLNAGTEDNNGKEK